MKILFIIALVLLYATGVHSNGIRVKRGLSPDQQNKLTDALNADRRNFGMEHSTEKHNIEMEALEYDTVLEEQVDTLPSGGECYKSKASFVPLKVDKATFDGLKKIGFLSLFNAPLFDPRQTSIGCSTKYTCSDKMPNIDILGEIAGKTVTYYGMCLLGPNNRPIKELAGLSLAEYSGMTKIGKYGDLLGVSASSSSSAHSGDSSGRIFGLTLFLCILFFY